MSTASGFIEALDVLTLRGNRLFGDPGSWGAAIMPPPPSVAAGALRSRLLVRDRTDLAAFARGEVHHEAVGAPQRPGTFTLADFQLARREDDGRIEPRYPLPADLVASGKGPKYQLDRVRPTRVAGILGDAPLPLWPVLAQAQERAKPAAGLWLTAAGLRAWMAGTEIDNEKHLVTSDTLWKTETRVGVGLDGVRRRADDGKLFALQAVAFARNAGFAVRVLGAALPEGMLRFGGDGRAARVQPADIDWPQPDYDAVSAAGRARLLLTSPGIFERGWLPTGAGKPSSTDGAPFELHGVRGRIVCAAVPRAQVVSGFDLARWQPKPAQRAVPAGAVYWIEDLQATPEALRKLVERGLWTDDQYNADMRRAEGFNRALIAPWSES
ncbi:MAG: hypothetical protein N2688_06345 [Burkholderiaceae bacterium]|nr:hypothetical protein [Burkholderiaceae bacterium]